MAKIPYKTSKGETISSYNSPVKSKDGTHKKVVLAKSGDKIKLVRFGAKGYSDYTQHKDEKRRANYRARHGAIKDKSGKPAIKNKLSAAYWSYNDLR